MTGIAKFQTVQRAGNGFDFRKNGIGCKDQQTVSRWIGGDADLAGSVSTSGTSADIAIVVADKPCRAMDSIVASINCCLRTSRDAVRLRSTVRAVVACIYLPNYPLDTSNVTDGVKLACV